MRLRDSLSCFGAPLAHVYKGGGRRRPAKGEARQGGGSPTRTPNLVGFGPPFLPTERGKGERREREKESGGRAPSPCPIRVGQGGRAPPPMAYLLSSTMAQ